MSLTSTGLVRQHTTAASLLNALGIISGALYAELKELSKGLSSFGESPANFPVSPGLGRMLQAASFCGFWGVANYLGGLKELASGIESNPPLTVDRTEYLERIKTLASGINSLGLHLRDINNGGVASYTALNEQFAKVIRKARPFLLEMEPAAVTPMMFMPAPPSLEVDALWEPKEGATHESLAEALLTFLRSDEVTDQDLARIADSNPYRTLAGLFEAVACQAQTCSVEPMATDIRAEFGRILGSLEEGLPAIPLTPAAFVFSRLLFSLANGAEDSAHAVALRKRYALVRPRAAGQSAISMHDVARKFSAGMVKLKDGYHQAALANTPSAIKKLASAVHTDAYRLDSEAFSMFSAALLEHTAQWDANAEPTFAEWTHGAALVLMLQEAAEHWAGPVAQEELKGLAAVMADDREIHACRTMQGSVRVVALQKACTAILVEAAELKIGIEGSLLSFGTNDLSDAQAARLVEVIGARSTNMLETISGFAFCVGLPRAGAFADRILSSLMRPGIWKRNDDRTTVFEAMSRMTLFIGRLRPGSLIDIEDEEMGEDSTLSDGEVFETESFVESTPAALFEEPVGGADHQGGGEAIQEEPVEQPSVMTAAEPVEQPVFVTADQADVQVVAVEEGGSAEFQAEPTALPAESTFDLGEFDLMDLPAPAFRSKEIDPQALLTAFLAAGNAFEDRLDVEDSELMNIMFEESEQCMADIGRCVGAWITEDEPEPLIGTVAEARRHVHTLKGVARTCGLMKVGAILHAVEDDLELVADDGMALRDSLSAYFGAVTVVRDALDNARSLFESGAAGASSPDVLVSTPSSESEWVGPDIVEFNTVDSAPSAEASDPAPAELTVAAEGASGVVEVEAIPGESLVGDDQASAGPAGDQVVVEVATEALPSPVEEAIALVLESDAGQAESATIGSDVVTGGVDQVIAPDSGISLAELDLPLSPVVDLAPQAQDSAQEPAQEPVQEPEIEEPLAYIESATLTLPTPVMPVAQASSRADGSVRVPLKLANKVGQASGQVLMASRRSLEVVERTMKNLREVEGNVGRMGPVLRELDIMAAASIPSTSGGASAHGFDALELDRYTALQELVRQLKEAYEDSVGATQALADGLRSVHGAEQERAQLSDDLQRESSELMLVGMSMQRARLERVVAKACEDAGRSATLVIDPRCRVPAAALDKLMPVFEHLLRNAVAHGIEAPSQRAAAGKASAGVITLGIPTAGNQDGNVVKVSVRDDGAGIDHANVLSVAQRRGLASRAEKYSDAAIREFLFMPGFSTSATVSQLAGRGVGLDVVRSAVAGLGGLVSVASKAASGTEFTLMLPTDVSSMSVVPVTARGYTCLLPLTLVARIVPVSSNLDVVLDERGKTVTIGGVKHELIDLATRVPASEQSAVSRRTRGHLVLMCESEVTKAVLVDSVGAQARMVVRQLGPFVRDIPGMVAGTTLPNGDAGLVLNPLRLLDIETEKGSRGEVEAPRAKVVMVVDDSSTVRMVTTRFLKRLGFEVVAARDGLEALQALARGSRPDGFLFDLEMPGMGGFELISEVRRNAEYKATPIIVISSRTAEKHRERAKELGASAYLTKPYEDAQLQEVLENLVGLPA